VAKPSEVLHKPPMNHIGSEFPGNFLQGRVVAASIID